VHATCAGGEKASNPNEKRKMHARHAVNQDGQKTLNVTLPEYSSYELKRYNKN